MKQRGFSLLETLIASGILIAVIIGTTSLSNALVVGTVVNADKTITNRWAVEGIELTQKIRDDNLLNKSTATNGTNWFAPAIADNGNDYGWYWLKAQQRPPNNNTWKLTKIVGGGNKMNADDFILNAKNTLNEKLVSDKLVGYRLICIESVAANSNSNTEDNYQCNSSSSGGNVSDGLRSDISACGNDDIYCSLTITSVRKNQLNSNKIIPAGNAVKVRSVVVWQDKDQFRSSSIATLMTNWKGYEQ